jgi:hypothetical protein
MAKIGQPFTSGDWIAKEGLGDEFIARWTEFVHWSVEEMGSGATESPVLIQDAANPRHFISFGGWSDPETVKSWREHPEFQQRLGSCRELCDEFAAGDYTVAAAPLS